MDSADSASKELKPEPSPEGAAVPHFGETAFTRRVLIALSLAALFTTAGLLLAYTPEVLLLTFAAVWFGVVLRHAAVWVAGRTRLSEGWALGLIITALILGLIGFLVFLGWQIADQVGELVKNLEGAVESVRDRLKEYPRLQKVLRLAPSAEQAVQGAGGSQSVQTWLLTPVGLTVNVLFIVFTGLYLAASPALYTNGLVKLFPVGRRPQMRRVFDEAADALWHWTIARLASMAIVGTMTGVGLALLGIPMAITFGILTGLLVFVPNIGPVLAVLPPTLIAFTKGGYWPLYVVAFFIAMEFVESYLITPVIHEKEDNLPAAITIVAQLLFGLLFGLLGVTFAMPIALVTMIFVNRLYVQQTLEGGMRAGGKV